MSDQPADLGYCVISGRDLLRALRRVQAGEKADLVYAELHANGKQIEDDQS